MKNIPYYEMGEWKFRMVQNVMEKNNNNKKKEWERNFLKNENDILTEKERLPL